MVAEAGGEGEASSRDGQPQSRNSRAEKCETLRREKDDATKAAEQRRARGGQLRPQRRTAGAAEGSAGKLEARPDSLKRCEAQLATAERIAEQRKQLASTNSIINSKIDDMETALVTLVRKSCRVEAQCPLVCKSFEPHRLKVKEVSEQLPSISSHHLWIFRRGVIGGPSPESDKGKSTTARSIISRER